MTLILLSQSWRTYFPSQNQSSLDLDLDHTMSCSRSGGKPSHAKGNAQGEGLSIQCNLDHLPEDSEGWDTPGVLQEGGLDFIHDQREDPVYVPLYGQLVLINGL